VLPFGVKSACTRKEGRKNSEEQRETTKEKKKEKRRKKTGRTNQVMRSGCVLAPYMM
jgi:hypothetical protein